MEDKSRIYALCGTLAVVALLVAILLFAALSYPPAERPRWDVDKSEVLLADEYVPMDRIIPSDIGDDEPVAGDLVEGPDAAPGQASSVDIDDAGDIGVASPGNTASEPSAVKETVKPEPVKPATPRKNDEENEKARARNINTNVNNAFTARPDNSTGNNTGAQSSQEGGNSSSPSKGVTPGAKIGNGWSISSYGDVGAKGKPLGSVIIEVEVNSQGKVISATPAGGTPPAASNPAVIAECMKAARQSKFRRSLKSGSPSRTRGTITWTFK